MSFRNRAISPLATAFLALIAFAIGFIACLHLKSTSPEVQRIAELALSGSAPPAIRTAVMDSLRTLQTDYARRDPAELNSLTQNLFPKDGDILILGTEGGVEEWVRGAPNAGQFISADWQHWGDLHLDLDRTIVWSSGDVAWVATIGIVDWKKMQRPIRFTAILTREKSFASEKDRWVFRQMHFQWDDADPSKADLFRLGTYRTLLRDMIR